MGWLYLIFSVGCAYFTWNALRPRRRGRPLSLALGLVAGASVSEFPLHHLAWQLLATLAFAWTGALATAPGLAGLSITGVSWLVLGVLFIHSIRAGEVAETALRSTLGVQYPTELLVELEVPPTDERTPWPQRLFPYPLSSAAVECIRDIQYDRERGTDLRLDIYRGREPRVGCPVLLQIHGGAWCYGSKRGQGLPLMNRMAEHGWVCVSVDYRLSPHATFPDHLVDVKRALCWVKDNISLYGGDPEFVVVTGESAGGHLAAMLALTADDVEYQPGFETEDTRVQACVPFYGIYDLCDRNGVRESDMLPSMLEHSVLKGSREEMPEDWERASPIARIGVNAPPFFVIHGRADSIVPVAEARFFVQALQDKSSATVAYAELPYAQHGFDLLPSIRTLQTVRVVQRFLTHVYGGYLRDRGLVGC